MLGWIIFTLFCMVLFWAFICVRQLWNNYRKVSKAYYELAMVSWFTSDDSMEDKVGSISTMDLIADSCIYCCKFYTNDGDCLGNKEICDGHVFIRHGEILG